MDPVEFGNYLRSLRKAKRLTIDQLASSLEVSNAYVSQIETGKRGIPSPDLLKQFHLALDVAYEHLMEKAGYMGTASPSSHDLMHVFNVNDSVYYKGIRLSSTQQKLIVDILEEFINTNQEKKNPKSKTDR